MIINTKLPELLAPCGSPDALYAAIAAGADAVYFGCSAFNARMNAKNFEGDSLRDAIDLCRTHHVRTNITLNTLIHDREMSELLRTVEQLYRFGCDALIVADLGAAALIHRYFPEIELHASTQAAGHHTDAAKILAELGFSRMVAARELSFTELSTLCRESPIETELFIHGAICVSQSGQCLASSLIGGRSGNRGECAQPCRLPYRPCGANAKCSYALSLRDLCLASHITELLSLGAASLKIEGRMKSPDYVYGVTRIYRRLLDERRDATPDELAELRALFSRSGFTDGYFKKKLGREMLGVRTDADKADSAVSAKPTDYKSLLRERRQPLSLSLTLEIDKPARLTVKAGALQASVAGAIPEPAKSCPLTEAAIKKNLEKLGNTPFFAESTQILLHEELMLPLSALNALRRDAVEQLCDKLLAKRERRELPTLDPPELPLTPPALTARFAEYSRIPRDVSRYALVYLPLEQFRAEMTDRVSGVILPPVIFDSETAEIAAMLRAAYDAGIRHALVSNLGHIRLAKEAGMQLHGDFRLNIYNRWSAEVLYSLGFAELMASPELTLPQLRDLGLSAVIYGRIPLMTLEKCVLRDLYSCKECQKRGFLSICDRKNASFPITRSWQHRNILYNSVPVWMADRTAELRKFRIPGGHFLFTDESASRAEEIERAYQTEKSSTPPESGVRRIAK